MAKVTTRRRQAAAETESGGDIFAHFERHGRSLNDGQPVVTSRKDGRMVMYRLSPRGSALLSVLFDRERVPYGAERG